MANFHPPPVGGTARTDPLFVSPTPARGSAACLENECVSGRLLVWRGFRVIQCSFASGAAIVGFVRGIIARFAAMVSRKGSKEWYHGCLDVSTTTVYWQRRNRNVVLLPLTLSGPCFLWSLDRCPPPTKTIHGSFMAALWPTSAATLPLTLAACSTVALPTAPATADPAVRSTTTTGVLLRECERDIPTMCPRTKCSRRLIFAERNLVARWRLGGRRPEAQQIGGAFDRRKGTLVTNASNFLQPTLLRSSSSELFWKSDQNLKIVSSKSPL